MGKNRRALIDRFKIPDAFIEIFTDQTRFLLFTKFTRKMPLHNLSKSGICFVSSKPYKKGQFLLLNVNIPGERKIKLKADVCWVKNGYQKDKYLVGSQIRAFGNQDKFNSFSILKRLKEIEYKYHS
jgi:hypothetical protein